MLTTPPYYFKAYYCPLFCPHYFALHPAIILPPPSHYKDRAPHYKDRRPIILPPTILRGLFDYSTHYKDR